MDNSENTIGQFYGMKTKEAAMKWIEQGGPCIYRFGLQYRGAGARLISSEDAEKMISKYSFGIGWYELDWNTHNGEKVLEFNELGANDLF